MKSYIILTVLAVFILAGCSSTKNTSEYDDVYYSTRAEKKQKEADNMQSSDPDYYVQSENSTTDYYMEDYDAGEYVSYEDQPYYSESETVKDPDGTTYITNNYYGSEGYGGDYYDYSYSARVNRFYNPYAGFNYYSPCYVGFYYDPWYYPYYYGPSFSFSFSWGWGWGGYGCGYPYYGYPYYGYPYNNYWYGYNNGYYNGYWDGYYASGYGYGNNSYYYGPRTSGGSSNTPSGSRSTTDNYAQKSTQTYSDRNRPLLSSGVVAIPESSSGTGSRNDDATVVKAGRSGLATDQLGSGAVSNVSGRNTGSALAAGSATALEASRQDPQKATKKPSQTTKPRYTYKKPTSSQTNSVSTYQPGESINTRSRTQPTQKYSKPESYNASRNTSRTGNTNPAQRSALYSKPSSGTKSYSMPSQSNRSSQYAKPSRSNTKSYSQPSRSSSSYSRPANTGSSRSSYSRPSSSGSSRSSSGARSISSPSRSGGSSSGGGRSSSSGSGGRR